MPPRRAGVLAAARRADPLAPTLALRERAQAADRGGAQRLRLRRLPRRARARCAFHGAEQDAGPSTIGRRGETDVSLDWDAQVSGLHAELHHIGGEWTIVDDGLSTNGTFVDGRASAAASGCATARGCASGARSSPTAPRSARLVGETVIGPRARRSSSPTPSAACCGALPPVSRRRLRHARHEPADR